MLTDSPRPPDSTPIDLLSGIQVLDLSSSIAGPYAALLLADFGADVVKIELPNGGDDCRAWGPPFLDGESLWFLSVNRNKRSLALDYATDQGAALLQQLVRNADVVIVNKTLAVQKKLGIDFGSLSAINPRLVHASITGFGLEGARADLPCYDLIAEGYSGVMDLTGEASNGPQKVGTPAADLLSGADAAMAVMAALRERERSGRGHAVDIAMVESMTRFMAPRIVPFLGSGELPRRSGGRDSVIAVYQVFEAADGPLTIGLGNDRIWARFWQVLDRPEMALDSRYAGNAARRERRAEIVAEIQTIIARQSRAHWLSRFAQARIPAGPINRIDEVAVDPELRERGLIYMVHRDGYQVPQVGLGIRVDGSSATYRIAPPRLGEHSESILRNWLELGEETLAQLRHAGIVCG